MLYCNPTYLEATQSLEPVVKKEKSFKVNTKRLEKKTKEERIGKQMPKSNKILGSSGKNSNINVPDFSKRFADSCGAPVTLEIFQVFSIVTII